MPRLAEGFVSELKDRIDLHDLVSRYVQLKKSGASWVGLSPFNKEKTPPFTYIHKKVFQLLQLWRKRGWHNIHSKVGKFRLLRGG